MTTPAGFSERLFALGRAGLDAQLAHPPVRGIAAGTLDEAVFRRWLVQDWLFLRLFALAAARSPEAAILAARAVLRREPRPRGRVLGCLSPAPDREGASMPTLHVLRVFTASDGSGGNPLGVFLDGGDVPPGSRQAVAAELGFAETVFVDDPAAGRVAIFTPSEELPFAGHPLVGTSWLLARERAAVAVLRPPAGEVPTWTDGQGVTWIRGRAEWAPPMELLQLARPDEVDALTGAPDGLGFVDVWAWADEAAGLVRSRVFAPGVGIHEDEATGAAAVRLVTQLGRPIVIRQGAGSLLRARPGPEGSADVGGAAALAETRDHRLPLGG